MEIGLEPRRRGLRWRIWLAVGLSTLVCVVSVAHVARSGLADRCPTVYTRAIAPLPSWPSCQALTSTDGFAVTFCRDHIDPRRGYVDVERRGTCPRPPEVLAADKAVDAFARRTGPDAFLVQVVSASQQWATEHPETRGDCRWRFPFKLAAVQSVNVSVLRTSTDWAATREVRLTLAAVALTH